MFEPVLGEIYPLSVEKGRDIRAGHLRGWGIEYGNLIEVALSREESWLRAVDAAQRRGTLLSLPKLANLYLILRFAVPKDGPINIIEFGSYRGGGVAFFATALRELGREGRVFGLDTFAGMPKTNSVMDLHGEGDFKDCDLPSLKDFIAAEGLENRVELVQGRFDQTLPDIIRQGDKFALIHCDCDVYDGVKYTCQNAELLAGSGAHLVFDDALHGSCLGAFTAIEEEMIQRRGMYAEQVYPHLVYRLPGLSA